MRKPGYKTSEFWFTVVSFIFSGLYLLGIIGENDQKEELITVVSHAVESCILIGGQLIILYRYIKGRTEEKIESEKHTKYIPVNNNDDVPGGVNNNIDPTPTTTKKKKKKTSKNTKTKETKRKTDDKSRNKTTDSTRSRQSSNTNQKQPRKRTKTSDRRSLEDSSDS